MLAVAAVLVLVMIQLRLVVVPILIATLLAAAVSPLVRVLHRRGLPKALAVWVALLAGLAAIGVVVAIVVSGARNELDELTARASEGLDELEQFLVSGPIPIDPAQLEQARTAVVDLLNSEQFRTGAVAGATAAAEAVAGTFLAVVILFFLLRTALASGSSSSGRSPSTGCHGCGGSASGRSRCSEGTSAVRRSWPLSTR